ncbi:MotA/TolQ/ExbB proton channel family protein [Pseudoalteromonas luteoviolacea]|uniref:MotA/TolQ/ExbB proton channel family protein n=1 Tax=Pseudoalteromonas luteoviolacea TaxID=43657 RepID=UPI001F2AC40B|nr:MotA/TolQ/ExbB proton channel family protein [Pseudoalteromonas luteoviolacea]MCF6441511.1 MotA/TolQ/ExbB proton channel family protein [Pseudoalteromonas luteoviolacea]
MTNIFIYLSQFDPIILAIFLLLLAMSCLTWSRALHLCWSLLCIKRQQSHAKQLWHKQETLVAFRQAHVSPNSKLFKRFGLYYHIAKVGNLAKQQYLDTPSEQLTLSDFLASQLTLYSKRALPKHGLNLLATTAACAPFIGLLGTVWGIHLSLNVIGEQTTATLTTLAPAIAEALIITGVGIVVAIPAVLFYNFFAKQYEQLQTDLNYFAQQWHNYLLTGHSPAHLSGS